MNIKRIIFGIHISLTLIMGCSSTEPSSNGDEPPIDSLSIWKLSLRVEDFSCVEAWLRVSAEDVTLPRKAELYRGDTLIKRITLRSRDTILLDSGLEPGVIYYYQAALLSGDTIGIKSERASVQTMDTTSQEYTWELYEFGSQSPSYFLDVAIIDENNIWAVGDIRTEETYTYDSLGNFIQPYNAAHWNGERWELKRVFYIKGSDSYFNTINSLYSFDDGAIFFSNCVLLKEGVYYSVPLNISFPYAVNKIWGKSSSDMYIVGSEGSIAHYDGSLWRRVEKSTELPITDIFGDEKGNIYASASKKAFNLGAVLKLSGLSGKVIITGCSDGSGFKEEELFKSQLYGPFEYMWIDKGGKAYTGGGFLYRYAHGQWDYVKDFAGNYIGGNNYASKFGFLKGSRGTDVNNMFVVGQRNTVRHYNGKRWRQIGEPYSIDSPTEWLNVDVKDNIAVAVGGKTAAKGVIMMMRK